MFSIFYALIIKVQRKIFYYRFQKMHFMQRQDNNRISVWDGLFYNDIPSTPQ